MTYVSHDELFLAMGIDTSLGEELLDISPTFPDIKQCAMNNGGCQQVCTELIPGFQCSCQAGYVLASNGFNCTGKAHWPAVFALSITF